MNVEEEIITCGLCNFRIRSGFKKHEKTYRHQRKLNKAESKLRKFIKKDRTRMQSGKGFYGKFKGLKKMIHFRNVMNLDL